MQLVMLKDGANSKIKNDLANIQSNYLKKESWLDEYFKEKGFDDFCINTNIIVKDFELEIGDSSLDAKNSVILHSAMKNLLPIQAREEKMWAYYTHTKFWSYMKERWNIKASDLNETSRIRSRYFFQGMSNKKIKTGTVPYVRNGLSRLWWAGYIVYCEELEDPYEYIDELFVSQDLFVGICEREISKNKKLTLAILRSIRKYEVKKIENNTQLLRDVLKDINFSAGLIMYDVLDGDVIEEKINKIFLENLRKLNLMEVA